MAEDAPKLDPFELEKPFWITVGADYDNSLKGFIEQVKDFYKQKFAEEKPTKVFIFDSSKVLNSFCITISSGINPYVAGIRIEQWIERLDDLLGNLDGNLTSYYPCIDASQLPANNPDISYKIKNNRLSSLELKKDPSFKNLKDKLASLTPEEECIIRKADAIDVKHDVYENNDPNSTLIHLLCKIKRADDQHHFVYSLSTANLDPIPESFYPSANGIFSNVSNKFILAYRARVSDFAGV